MTLHLQQCSTRRRSLETDINPATGRDRLSEPGCRHPNGIAFERACAPTPQKPSIVAEDVADAAAGAVE
jgi:hypothetical protein